ncbi:hypothetical protein Pcinc_027791 [Petrolisthes cinctipes]|uniref:Uncharacterized protein n=1 Tax=Petrolisthes cinctipes TaxID=88211 RepID=A0AAE1K858_PETCI|nr:hypothetical protein Pcinc_027791 [Petrolisthes cinctipes]
MSRGTRGRVRGPYSCPHIPTPGGVYGDLLCHLFGEFFQCGASIDSGGGDMLKFSGSGERGGERGDNTLTTHNCLTLTLTQKLTLTSHSTSLTPTTHTPHHSHLPLSHTNLTLTHPPRRTQTPSQRTSREPHATRPNGPDHLLQRI